MQIILVAAIIGIILVVAGVLVYMRITGPNKITQNIEQYRHVNYGEKALLLDNKIFVFPDFKLEYIGKIGQKNPPHTVAYNFEVRGLELYPEEIPQKVSAVASASPLATARFNFYEKQFLLKISGNEIEIIIEAEK